MNERIKLLAEQAEDYATVEYAKWIPTPDFSGIPHIRKIFNEKFAELIVQECASICELNGQSYKYSFTPAKAQLAESTSNHCGLMIKKHFGVEE
jgi:hypothetical protein